MGKRPKFPVGTYVAVTDCDQIARHSGISTIPLIGWVERNEEVFAGKRHIGWRVHIRGHKQRFYEYEEPLCIAWEEAYLSRVELKRFGKLLRHKDSALCPWCSDHGRNYTNWPHDMPVHPNMQECDCWWHHHREHMPGCPFGSNSKSRSR